MTILRPLPAREAKAREANAPRYRVVTVKRLPVSESRKIARTERKRAPSDRPASIFPPLDFPIFGLDRTWKGPRWLNAVIGSYGEPAQSVWLAHGERLDPDREVLVMSHRLSEDQGWCPSGAHAERMLAWTGLVRIIDATLPVLAGDDRRRFFDNFEQYVDARAGRWARWAPTRWRIENRVVTARFARFAGGWAAYAFERDRFALAVTGVGADPHGLGLRRLRSAAAYHFDLEEPFPSYPSVATRSFEQALGADADRDREPRRLHADHRKIITATAADTEN